MVDHRRKQMMSAERRIWDCPAAVSGLLMTCPMDGPASDSQMTLAL